MKPYNQGQKDFWKGQVVNPYRLDTAKWKEWEMGFRKSYFANLEKVKEREQRRKVG